MNGIGASWKLILAGAVGVTALVAAHFAGEEPPAAQPAPPAAAAPAPAAVPSTTPSAAAQDEEIDGPVDPSPIESGPEQAPQDAEKPDTEGESA